MKKREITELRTKSKEECERILANKRNELKKLIVDSGARKLKNVSLKAEVKKDIARILTIMKEFDRSNL